MKKLMFAVSAAMAFGLFAEDVGKVAGTSFEDETTGAVAVTGTAVGLKDSGWTTSDDAAQLVIKEAGAYTGDNRPTAYAGETNAKFLAVKTKFGAPLEKTLASQTAPYFDSLVQLTVCDMAPEIAPGTKVAVWLLGDDNGATNVMVTAFDLTTQEAKNYDCGAFSNYGCEAGDWCRLTVKAMDNDKAFVVFLNGTALVNSDDKGFGALSDAALVWNANGKLFPFLDQTATTTGLSVVGLDGQGAVDDVVFTTTAPAFAADVVKYFTLTWTPAEVSAISANGQALTVADGSATILVTKAGMTVTVAVTAADGYEFNSLGDLSNCTAAGVVATVAELDASAAKVVMDTTVFSGGKGTAESPYKIGKVDDLFELCDWLDAGTPTVGVHFKLTTDIDWSTAKLADGSDLPAFPGIGASDKVNTADNAFQGVFDGGNHTIRNLRLCAAERGVTTCYRGLFNKVANATVKNLTVDTVICDETITSATEFGGALIIGKAAKTCTFENLTAKGYWNEPSDITKGTTHNVAGICCRIEADMIRFLACTNEAALYCKYTKVGGICAYLASPAVFTNCCNKGKVWANVNATTYPNVYEAGAGGLVGMPCNGSVTFTGCVNSGLVGGDRSDGSTLNYGQFFGSCNKSNPPFVDGGGNVGRDDLPAFGAALYTSTVPTKLCFATDNGDGTVSFCDTPSAAGSYKVMGGNGLAISFGEQKGDRLVLDQSIALYSGTVTTTVEDMAAVASVDNKVTSYTIQEPVPAIQLTVTFDSNVTSVKVGETTVTETGKTVDVIPGAPYAVVVKGKDWYKFGYGTLEGCTASETGIVIGSDATAAALPIMTTKVSADVDVESDPRSAAAIAYTLGVANNNLIANDQYGDGKERLAKAVAWATSKGVSIADVNKITFNTLPGVSDKGTGPDPENVQAEAFLLDCAPTETAVAEAKAAFKIPAFEIDAEGEVSFGEFENGGDYGNGHLKQLGATAVDGKYTEDCEDPSFFKFKLQK